MRAAIERLSGLASSVARLPVALASIITAARRVELATDDLLREAIAARKARPGPGLTYVYLLPVEGPMMATSTHVALGSQVTFKPMMVVPAGTWIVAVGPGRVLDVRAGNVSQSVFEGSGGQVCQLKESVLPGTWIFVVLRPPESP